MKHQLTSVQNIPASLQETWHFFSSASNLLRITPLFLNLKVKGRLNEEAVSAGQTIQYKVKPLLGIPLSWQTEITEVAPFAFFVDEQKKGPYKFWRHQHFFQAIDGGVQMRDVVQYELPLGILGNLAHTLAAKDKLYQIFTYRYYKINELFGDWPGGEIDLKIM